MSTCNRLDLQTLGSQPVMPKNLPDRLPSPPLFAHPLIRCCEHSPIPKGCKMTKATKVRIYALLVKLRF